MLENRFVRSPGRTGASQHNAEEHPRITMLRFGLIIYSVFFQTMPSFIMTLKLFV